MWCGSSKLSYRINLYPKQSGIHARRFWHSLFGLLAIVAMLAASERIWAADITPVSSMENGSTGNVGSASLLNPGEITAGVGYRRLEQPLTGQVLGVGVTEDAPAATLIESRVQQYGAYFGLGINRMLELSAAVRGTSEEYSGFHNVAGNEDVVDADATTRTSGFSNASLLTKIRMLDGNALDFSIAPFVESGAGSQAEASIARSAKTRGGWATMISYDAPRILRLNLNGGYRYREREDVGSISLRNELFYMASVEAMFSRAASIFVTGEGRRIKIADNDASQNTSGRIYKNAEAAAVTGGLNFLLGQTRISVYGGARLSDTSLGAGKNHFGMNLSYAFGERSRTAELQRVMATEEDIEAETAASEDKDLKEMQPDLGGQQKDADNNDAVNDPYGRNIDILNDADARTNHADDDFARVRKSIQSEKTSAKKGANDDATAEAELEKIYEAEAEKKAQDERAFQASEAKRRKAMQRSIEAGDEETQRLRREVLEGEDLPEITDEEANWRGLEQ